MPTIAALVAFLSIATAVLREALTAPSHAADCNNSTRACFADLTHAIAARKQSIYCRILFNPVGIEACLTEQAQFCPEEVTTRIQETYRKLTKVTLPLCAPDQSGCAEPVAAMVEVQKCMEEFKFKHPTVMAKEDVDGDLNAEKVCRSYETMERCLRRATAQCQALQAEYDSGMDLGGRRHAARYCANQSELEPPRLRESVDLQSAASRLGASTWFYLTLGKIVTYVI